MRVEATTARHGVRLGCCRAWLSHILEINPVQWARPLNPECAKWRRKIRENNEQSIHSTMKRPILFGKPEEISLIPEEVQHMLDNEGFYIGSRPGEPGVEVPLVSMSGKVFSMQVDTELDPTRFIEGHTLSGPFRAGMHDVVTCVYCGHEYPEGTPTAKHDLLTAHIKTCDKHPMRELEARNERLLKALVGLVGSDNKEVLESMEATMRLLPASDADRIAGIDGIHAILSELAARQA